MTHFRRRSGGKLEPQILGIFWELFPGMDPAKEEEENEEKIEFSQDVLSHLESLERRDRARAVQRERRERGRERLLLLRARAAELRQRRDRLRLALILSQNSPGFLRIFAGIAKVPGLPGLPSGAGAVLRWRLRELQQLRGLLPLTGLCCAQLSRRGLSFSLHTACQGALLDSFHLELLQDPSQGSRESQDPSQASRESQECRESLQGLRLGRHCIPPSVPLQGLAQQFLPGRPREFLRSLGRALSAFVAGRQQLRAGQVVQPQGLPRGRCCWRCPCPAPCARSWPGADRKTRNGKRERERTGNHGNGKRGMDRKQRDGKRERTRNHGMENGNGEWERTGNHGTGNGNGEWEWKPRDGNRERGMDRKPRDGNGNGEWERTGNNGNGNGNGEWERTGNHGMDKWEQGMGMGIC
ncbi:centromere protein O [Agelaius phoeniceus]|uniref:centromere protein O n=1 Tax=Agelaius phoeniceus TaxID=39638 RepID=UPI00405510A7